MAAPVLVTAEHDTWNTGSGSSTGTTAVSLSFTPAASDWVVVVATVLSGSSSVDVSISNSGFTVDSWRSIGRPITTGSGFFWNTRVFAGKVTASAAGTVTLTRSDAALSAWHCSGWASSWQNLSITSPFGQLGYDATSSAVSSICLDECVGPVLSVALDVGTTGAGGTPTGHTATTVEATINGDQIRCSYRVAGGSGQVQWSGLGADVSFSNVSMAVELRGTGGDATRADANYGFLVGGSLSHVGNARIGSVEQVTSAPIFAIAKGTRQAVAAAVMFRRPTPKPRVAQPIVAPGRAVVARATVVTARARMHAQDARTRQTPTPHLARPIVGAAVFVAPRAIEIAQAIAAALVVRRGSPRSHVAASIVAPGGPVTIVGRRGSATLQHLQRPLVGRVPLRPHLAKPVVTPVVVVTPPFLPAKIVSQALARPYVGRTIFAPHLAKPIVAPGGPVVPGGLRVLQSLAPARRWWRDWDARFSAAKPIVAPGVAVVAASTKVSQVLQSSLAVRRFVPRPHLAVALAGTQVPFVAPASTVTSQALQAPLLVRGSLRVVRVAQPIVAPGRAVVAGRTAVLQSEQRALWNARLAPKPHLAKPIVAPGGPVIAGATMRAWGGRRSGAPNPHVATPIVSQFYVPPPLPPVVTRPKIVAQALQAPLTARRGAPRPHVAQPIRGAAVAPFLAPPATVTQTSITIRPARQLLPRPIVAPGTAVIAGRTETSQALASHLRARRGVPRPHLAPPTLVVVTFPPTTTRPFIVSAVRASLAVRRGAPKPHLARPIVGAAAAAPPVVVAAIRVFQQALRAPALARRTPKPHLAPPNLFVPPVVTRPVGVRAVQAPLAYRRGAPAPHLAKPIVAPGGPVIAGGTRRSPGGRRSAAPNAHLPFPIINPPLPPPLPPVVTRPKIVHAKPLPVNLRRIIRPHLAPGLVNPPPLPPVVTRPKSIRAIPRPTPLRRTFNPHVAKPIVAPGRPVVPGRTQVTVQAQRTCRLARTILPPRPHLARSLSTPATRARVTITVETNRNYLGQLELAHQGIDARYSNRYSKVNASRYSLIKETGAWSLVEMPKAARINAAQYFYQGGMDHDIPIAVANEIAAAGYGAFITVY